MKLATNKVDRERWVGAASSGMKRYIKFAQDCDKSIGTREAIRACPIIIRFADDKDLSEPEVNEVLIFIMFSEGEKHADIREEAFKLITSIASI